MRLIGGGDSDGLSIKSLDTHKLYLSLSTFKHSQYVLSVSDMHRLRPVILSRCLFRHTADKSEKRRRHAAKIMLRVRCFSFCFYQHRYRSTKVDHLQHTSLLN